MYFRGRKLRDGDKIWAYGVSGAFIGIYKDADVIILLDSKRGGHLGKEYLPDVIKQFNLSPEVRYDCFPLRAIEKHEPRVCTCVECKASNDWAEPNMPDGTFLCYSCKKDYAWKYNEARCA